MLRRSHRTARLKFALRARPRLYWHRAMFMDEASFGVYQDPRGRWVVEGKAAPYRPSERWAVSIRVWAAVGWKGRTKLFRIPKSMTAAEFARFMERKGVPAMCAVHGDPARDWRLVQDGDGTHSARITLQTLAKLRVRLVPEWPAKSPDLNVIENVWSMVGHALQKYHATTPDGLWSALKAAWSSIKDSKIWTCVRSLPRRLREVVAAQGGPTRY